jgi:cellulose synthase/poly-beta-1,6-N-acetylglucosamine synthase-like glycosyltransferase
MRAAAGNATSFVPFLRDIGQLDRAVNDLRRRAPHLSAATPLPFWQQATLLALPAGLSAGLILLDGSGLFLWSLVLGVPFFTIALIRGLAIWYVLARPMVRSRPKSIDRRFDDRLPTVSVLVPLYRETSVVRSLIAAMARLDYPAERLEILLITEADDQPTRRALLDNGFPANMRIVTVPPGLPKTKPRALNYALQNARGTLVAVFDAEDKPDPAQLRRAAEAFVEGGPRLACVQARLTIENADESFLSRQFALEYAALFGGLLPALERLGLPLPLGGTSNHFRRDLLLKCGGWDPFNVTEDADLGFRLARLGYEVSVIDSETAEEAPVTWRIWVGQRTRWIKGWIQTYLVHMRRPRRLWRDLGGWGFAGFQVTIGGMILAMLVHPWFYILAIVHGYFGWRLVPDSDFLWWLCGFNLAAGYVAAALLTAATAISSGSAGRLVSVIWLPVYWLAISFAAYRAVLDLIVRPFYWEKTMHGTGRAKPRTRSHPQRRRR